MTKSISVLISLKDARPSLILAAKKITELSDPASVQTIFTTPVHTTKCLKKNKKTKTNTSSLYNTYNCLKTKPERTLQYLTNTSENNQKQLF